MNHLTWSRPHLRTWRAFDRLYSVCLPQNSRADRSYLIREYYPHTHLAWKGDSLVGFFVAWKSATPDTVWLESIGVAPSERGTGLSSAILEEAEKLALQMGGARVELAVDGYNQIAIQFYRRHGYKGVARPGEKLTFAKSIAATLAPTSKTQDIDEANAPWLHTSRSPVARALRLTFYRAVTL